MEVRFLHGAVVGPGEGNPKRVRRCAERVLGCMQPVVHHLIQSHLNSSRVGLVGGQLRVSNLDSASRLPQIVWGLVSANPG